MNSSFRNCKFLPLLLGVFALVFNTEALSQSTSSEKPVQLAAAKAPNLASVELTAKPGSTAARAKGTGASANSRPQSLRSAPPASAGGVVAAVPQANQSLQQFLENPNSPRKSRVSELALSLVVPDLTDMLLAMRLLRDRVDLSANQGAVDVIGKGIFMPYLRLKMQDSELVGAKNMQRLLLGHETRTSAIQCYLLTAEILSLLNDTSAEVYLRAINDAMQTSLDTLIEHAGEQRSLRTIMADIRGLVKK
jgi:hypothetical protein